MVGRAKTGSGKTASFALPILHQLAKDPFGIFAVTLTPTRELAFQIADQFRALGAGMSLKDCVVVGGLDMLPQSLQLEANPHVLVATPGRLADHIRSGTRLHLDHVQFLVLDEADRLFEDSFAPELKTIMEALPDPAERQTLMFSATMTRKLLSFQKVTMQNPQYFEIDSPIDALVKTLEARYLLIPQSVKECYLVYLLRQSELSDHTLIVFVSTCRGCEIVAQLLAELDIDCVTLHSKINQARRLAALGKFRSGKSKVLIATDVASRGLDIPTVQAVINYDVPRMAEDYVHRIGRTARAGRSGLAVTFVSQYDVDIFKQIEDKVGKKMDEYELSENKVLQILKEVSQASKMAKIRLGEFGLTARKVDKRETRKKKGRWKNPEHKANPRVTQPKTTTKQTQPKTTTTKLIPHTKRRRSDTQ